MDRLVQDPDLRRILKIAAIFPRVSMVMLSWFWHIIYTGDCYYPRGGVQSISDALAGNFERYGGEILYQRRVSQILTQGGRANGVLLEDGTTFSARAIISDADARETFLDLLSETKLPTGLLKRLRRWRVSESFFYVYLGVEMDLGGRGIPPYPVIWYFPKKGEGPFVPDYIGIGIPSLNDGGIVPSGRHAVILGAFAQDFERWFGRDQNWDRKGYREWKEGMADALIRMADEAIPGLQRHIVVRESASPLTYHRYTSNSMGASSGWSMDAEHQYKLAQRTPISHLLLAGHWTFNPGGLPAAFMTGHRAAEWAGRILRDQKGMR